VTVAIVISQDGGVRFVFQKRVRVTYWAQKRLIQAKK